MSRLPGCINQTDVARILRAAKAIGAAGILDKSAHGCRKIAATRAADNGATVHELMAIFGWTGMATAAIYTREADRRLAGQRAGSKLANG